MLTINLLELCVSSRAKHLRAKRMASSNSNDMVGILGVDSPSFLPVSILPTSTPVAVIEATIAPPAEETAELTVEVSVVPESKPKKRRREEDGSKPKKRKKATGEASTTS
jgi:hypothetical protein